MALLLCGLLLAVAVAGFPARLGRFVLEGRGIDLRTHFLFYGDLLRHGGDPYDANAVAATRARRADLFLEDAPSPLFAAAYPAPVLLAFAPLSALPWQAAYAAWLLAGLGLLAASLVLVLRLPPNASPAWVWAAAGGTALLYGPLLYDAKSGQANLPALFGLALCLAFWVRGRHAAAGAALAAAALVKLPVAAVGLAFVLAGCWSVPAWAAAAGLVLVAASLLWVPPEAIGGYLHWLAGIGSDPGGHFAANSHVHSPLIDLSARGWLARAFAGEAGASVLRAPALARGLVVAAAVALLAAFVGRVLRARKAAGPGAGKVWDAGSRVRLFAAAACLPALLSPYVIYYNGVWLLLPLWVLLREAAAARAPWYAPAAALALLVEPSLAWRAPLAEAFPGAAAWLSLVPPPELFAAGWMAWWLTGNAECGMRSAEWKKGNGIGTVSMPELECCS